MASQRDRPLRSDGNPVPVGDLYAAGRSVGDEDHVMFPVDGPEIGDLSVIGPEYCGIEFQLFGDIRRPSLREALPDQNSDRPRTQEAPHGGLKGPRVRTGHDAGKIVRRDSEDPLLFPGWPEPVSLSPVRSGETVRQRHPSGRSRLQPVSCCRDRRQSWDYSSSAPYLQSDIIKTVQIAYQG